MERSALPFQRSCRKLCRQRLSAVHRCRFHITVMHASVDVVGVFTWNRKCVIWWRTPLIPDCLPLPSLYRPQASNICPGNMSRKVTLTLFCLPARAILAFTSLWGWPRCSVDWRQEFIGNAWRITICSQKASSPLCPFLSLSFQAQSPMTLMSQTVI